MNIAQRIVLWVALVVALLAGLFPPWRLQLGDHQFPFGYVFVGRPSIDDMATSGVRGVLSIDFARFAVQFCTLAFITGAIFFALCPRRPVRCQFFGDGTSTAATGGCSPPAKGGASSLQRSGRGDA